MRILSLIFILLCLLGLCYQTYLIIHEYLKYAVSTSVSLNQKNEYTVPSLSSCFRIDQVFDYDSFKIAYPQSNVTINRTNTQTVYFTGTESLKILSIDDIYRYTPTPSYLANFCEIRDASTFTYNRLEGVDCNRIFDIEKYVIASLVCYKITLKQFIMAASNSKRHSERGSNAYTKESAYFTPTDAGEIYFVFLNQSVFPYFDRITNVMYPIDNYPLREFPLSQLGSRRYNYEGRESVLNLFGSKSSTVTVQKMALPYETMCQNYQTRYGTIDKKLYRY